MTAMLCASLGACSTTPASEGLDGGTDDGGADTELVCDWQVTERPNGVGILYAVWGLSSTDVYATSGNIYHFDGAKWTFAYGPESGDVTGLWGSSSTDVFAVGGHYDSGDQSKPQSSISHYDGTSWSRTDFPGVGPLHGVWGFGPDDVFAVGEHNALYHYDGASW
ncbi:MAG: hypothetical protein PHU25_21650, partial [Deltaproteobacteria bacterium]|nr:hypothetical protein [Deltaproteobacteria bacterium]